MATVFCQVLFPEKALEFAVFSNKNLTKSAETAYNNYNILGKLTEM